MTERLPDSSQDKEMKDLRDIIQKQDQTIKKLKYYAWSFSEALDKNDIETPEVLLIRKELQEV